MKDVANGVSSQNFIPIIEPLQTSDETKFERKKFRKTISEEAKRT